MRLVTEESPPGDRPCLAATVRLRLRAGRRALLTFFEYDWPHTPEDTLDMLPGVAVLARWEDGQVTDYR